MKTPYALAAALLLLAAPAVSADEADQYEPETDPQPGPVPWPCTWFFYQLEPPGVYFDPWCIVRELPI